MIGASPSGKASAFGADIRRFESCRPSKQKRQPLRKVAFFVVIHFSIQPNPIKSITVMIWFVGPIEGNTDVGCLFI